MNNSKVVALVLRRRGAGRSRRGAARVGVAPLSESESQKNRKLQKPWNFLFVFVAEAGLEPTTSGL